MDNVHPTFRVQQYYLKIDTGILRSLFWGMSVGPHQVQAYLGSVISLARPIKHKIQDAFCLDVL